MNPTINAKTQSSKPTERPENGASTGTAETILEAPNPQASTTTKDAELDTKTQSSQPKVHPETGTSTGTAIPPIEATNPKDSTTAKETALDQRATIRARVKQRQEEKEAKQANQAKEVQAMIDAERAKRVAAKALQKEKQKKEKEEKDNKQKQTKGKKATNKGKNDENEEEDSRKMPASNVANLTILKQAPKETNNGGKSGILANTAQKATATIMNTMSDILGMANQTNKTTLDDKENQTTDTQDAPSKDDTWSQIARKGDTPAGTNKKYTTKPAKKVQQTTLPFGTTTSTAVKRSSPPKEAEMTTSPTGSPDMKKGRKDEHQGWEEDEEDEDDTKPSAFLTKLNDAAEKDGDEGSEAESSMDEEEKEEDWKDWNNNSDSDSDDTAALHELLKKRDEPVPKKRSLKKQPPKKIKPVTTLKDPPPGDTSTKKTQPVSEPTAAKTATTGTNNTFPRPRGVHFSDKMSHRRIHTQYVDMQIEVIKSTALVSAVSAARMAFIESLKCIARDVDGRSILYRYLKASDEEDDACQGLDTLPTSATQLFLFADGFQSRVNGGRLYMRVRLGFDADVQDFFRAARDALKGLNAAIYPKALQEPDTTTIGWILFSDQAMLPEHWVEIFETCIRELATNEQNINTRRGAAMLRVRLGAQFKFIWDGTTKKMRPEGHKGARAMHLESTVECALLAYAVMREILSSNWFSSQYCSIPMRIIPVLKQSDSSGLKGKIHEAVELHRKGVASLTSTTTYDITNMDRVISKIGVSLRSLIMEMQTKKGEPLFSRASPDYKGAGGWVFTVPTIQEQEAHDVLRCIGFLLERKYGGAVRSRFNQDALETYDSMEWDEEKQRPITALELETDAVLALCSKLPWIDMSLIQEGEAQKEATAAELQRPEKISDLIEDASLSTFHPHSRRTGRPKSSMKQTTNTEVNQRPPEEVAITDQGSVTGQSVASGTSTLSKATMYTQLTTQMNQEMGRMETRLSESMTATMQALLTPFLATMQQQANTASTANAPMQQQVVTAPTANAPINQVSPTQTASPGEVPFSTEDPPPEGPSAL